MDDLTARKLVISMIFVRGTFAVADVDGWEQGFRRRLAEDQKKASAAAAQ